jgi:hypothetical protein
VRLGAPLLLVGLGAPLSGCAASLAMSAASLAVQAATPARPALTEDPRPAAVTACTERAAPHGQVAIIDAELRGGSRVTVWGTVGDEAQRRSFECRHDGRVRGFTLRPIAAR